MNRSFVALSAVAFGLAALSACTDVTQEQPDPTDTDQGECGLAPNDLGRESVDVFPGQGVDETIPFPATQQGLYDHIEVDGAPEWLTITLEADGVRLKSETSQGGYYEILVTTWESELDLCHPYAELDLYIAVSGS